jgi:N-methylhydantoinase B/oxoprolinase/acetone carboxylase alpha subunit
MFSPRPRPGTAVLNGLRQIAAGPELVVRHGTTVGTNTMLERKGARVAAEEMGAALRRTSISPNIKEMRDYSCALFDGRERVIAMGDHMPVHLGAMPMSVRVVVNSMTLEEDDVAILNDPYAGGTHLPDIPLVVPIFIGGGSKPAFYAASRAHHADVGGIYAGSMGPAQEIYQEGIRIPPIRLIRKGAMCGDVLALLLAKVRTPVEREGDLAAQIGACRVGERRIKEVVAKYGLGKINHLVEELLAYSERLMRAELRKMPAGVFEAEDFLDGDRVTDDPIRIAVAIRFDPSQGSAEIDFAGSSAQVTGSVNAVWPIHHLLRMLLYAALPARRGCSSHGGFDELGDGIGARGNSGERATPHTCSGRQCGDGPTNCRHVTTCVGADSTRSRTCGELWDDEQSDRRWRGPSHERAVHLL